MKKMLAIIAVLAFVTGAMAETITFTDGGVDANGLVTVNYTYTGADAPVAFGLVVTSDAAINAVTVPGYYDVFIDSAYSLGAGYDYPGEGTANGIPTAQVGVAGELDISAGATSFAISAGGLKDGETDLPPAAVDQVITLQIADFAGLAAGSYDIVIAADTVRGGVVSEAGAMDVVGVTVTVVVSDAGCTCYGDISADGATYGQDGLVNTNDFNVFLGALASAPGYEITDVPAELLCADLSADGATFGQDGIVNTNDFNVFLGRLASFPGYEGPCITE